MSSWMVDPKTGDYVMQGGAPVPTERLHEPCYIRMKVPRDGWMYAPDATYGSKFFELKKRKSSQDPTTLENVAVDALQPIVDDGRAKEIQVTVSVASRHNIGFETLVTDAKGTQQQFVLSGLGV